MGSDGRRMAVVPGGIAGDTATVNADLAREN